MKYSILFTLLFSTCFHLKGQHSFVKKNYYDQDRTALQDIITLSQKDSLPNGIYQSYFQNGSLESKGYYSKGQIDSLWVFYYQNGREKASGLYDQGIPTGIWKYFFENGQIKSEGLLRNTQKSGNWKYYYENGEVKSQGEYLEGRKHGIWNYFYEDQSLKAQTYYELNSASHKEFYPSGTVKSDGKIIDEKSSGLWVYYYETGEKEASGNFINGLRTGIWNYYYKNETISATGSFDNGKKTGIWKYFHDDGSLSAQGEMNQDQKDGYWKLFYPSGEIKGEVRYDIGSGVYKEYYPGGQVRAIGNIQNELKEGLWKYYSESGILDGEADFTRGKGLYTGFYPGGIIKMQGIIDNDKRIGEWTLFKPDGTIAGTYRPVYEELNPIFRTGEIIADTQVKTLRDKPEYRFKSNKLRYFDPVINEYTAIIMGTNPLWTFIGKIPIAVEYYKQERLGHEFQLDIHKNPFYKNSSKLDYFEIGTRGLSLTIRQKFYHNDSKLGMFYFGHELQAGLLEHQITTEDSADVLVTPVITKYEANQKRFAYSLLIGNRWMQRTNDSGVTLDFHVGVGVGRRDFQFDYELTPTTGGLFNNINQDRFYVPLIIGVNIGFAGPKRRSTSF